jgi:RNA polymerase sigma-70 factor, ECF subfamily
MSDSTATAAAGSVADTDVEIEFRELLQRARSGDLEAFEQIILRHQASVFRTALRLLNSPEDAEDAAQEVFLRLHKHLGKFDAEREFAPWLYRVTVNVCFSARRRQRGEEIGEMTSSEPDPYHRAESAELGRLLASELGRLPKKERAALVLRDLEGLTTQEVARILGSSEATVRSQISSARVKVKKFVETLRGRRT